MTRRPNKYNIKIWVLLLTAPLNWRIWGSLLGPNNKILSRRQCKPWTGIVNWVLKFIREIVLDLSKFFHSIGQLKLCEKSIFRQSAQYLRLVNNPSLSSFNVPQSDFRVQWRDRMSTPSSKSKSSKSGTPSSKDKKASGSSETKSSSQSKTKSTTPTKTKEESLSESSDSDEDFAVHVVREPRNTAVLDVAATIEQSTW